MPQKFDATRSAGVINMARATQPDIVINYRTGQPGDYDTPEQRIVGKSGFCYGRHNPIKDEIDVLRS